jgi:hypothetical protein
LVAKIQLDACTAGRKLNAWLGADSIEGGSIKDKELLCIEVGPAAAIAEVEELPDSKAKSDSSVESDYKDITAETPCLPLY